MPPSHGRTALDHLRLRRLFFTRARLGLAVPRMCSGKEGASSRPKPPHVALLFRIDLVITNAHHTMIASEGFDREITEPLSGRDKGVARLAFHILTPP